VCRDGNIHFFDMLNSTKALRVKLDLTCTKSCMWVQIIITCSESQNIYMTLEYKMMLDIM